MKLRKSQAEAREFRCRRCRSVLALYSRCSEVNVEFVAPTSDDLLRGDVIFTQEIKCKHCGEYSSMIVRTFGEEARPPRPDDHYRVIRIQQR